MSTQKPVDGGVTATLFTFALSYALWRNAAVGSVDWTGVIVVGAGAAICAAMGLHLPAATSGIDASSAYRPGGEFTGGTSDAGPACGSGWPIAAALGVTALGLLHQALWAIAPSVAAVVLTTGALRVRCPTGERAPHPPPSPEHCSTLRDG